MIKNKVKRILKTEEINRILEENLELKERLSCLSLETETLQGKMATIIDRINDLLEGKEYISLEYLKLREKPKILVCGFFGARNLGDELMLQVILKYFEERRIRVTILLSDNYFLDASIYAPHEVVHYPKCSSDILEMSKAFDTVIWAGGAHLDDVGYGFRGRATALPYSLNALSRAVIKNGGDVIVLGVSSNEQLNDERYINDLQFIIDNAKYFSLRDDNSLMTLKNAGLNTGKIKVIDDIALLDLEKPTIENNLGDELVVGVVYIITDDIYEQLGEYINSIIAYLKKNINKKIRITLIPFYDYRDNDKKGCEAIVDKYVLEKDLVTINDYVYNMKDLEKMFKKCDLIISMRYHATLIASNLGIRTIALDYSKRHRHYSNKIKYIQKKYNDELILCDFGEKSEKLLKAVDEALRKDVIDKNSQIDKIKEKLAEVLNGALAGLK